MYEWRGPDLEPVGEKCTDKAATANEQPVRITTAAGQRMKVFFV